MFIALTNFDKNGMYKDSPLLELFVFIIDSFIFQVGVFGIVTFFTFSNICLNCSFCVDTIYNNRILLFIIIGHGCVAIGIYMFLSIFMVFVCIPEDCPANLNKIVDVIIVLQDAIDKGRKKRKIELGIITPEEEAEPGARGTNNCNDKVSHVQNETDAIDSIAMNKPLNEKQISGAFNR